MAPDNGSRATGLCEATKVEPEPKRQCLSADGIAPGMDMTTFNVATGPSTSDSLGFIGQVKVTDKEQAWQDQWAEVFTMMHEGDMEARAGEYAEAVVALKKNAESLRRQRSTVQSSCEQLLHTAYREALQAHLKAMLHAASVGVSQEVALAARRTVEELCVQEHHLVPGLEQTEPPSLVRLGIGLPQPGVLLMGSPIVTGTRVQGGAPQTADLGQYQLG